MMTTKKIVFLFTVLATGFSSAAFAGDKWLGEEGDNWEQHITSTRTRAEVIAELKDARLKGFLVGGTEVSDPPVIATQNGRTRDEVRAELDDVKSREKIDAMYSMGG